MTKAQYERRQRLIADGRCPRCGLPVQPWPLRRPDLCHAGTTASACPRQWEDIHRVEQRLRVR